MQTANEKAKSAMTCDARISFRSFDLLCARLNITPKNMASRVTHFSESTKPRSAPRQILQAKKYNPSVLPCSTLYSIRPTRTDPPKHARDCPLLRKDMSDTCSK